MSAAVIDLKQRYALAVTDRVIPAAAWTPLNRAQDLIDQANSALQALDEELQGERARAHERGRAEGRQEALDQFAAATLALHSARGQLATQMRAQLTDLTIAVIERIAPALGADKVVPLLAGEVIRQLAFEPNVIVRVHPDVAEVTRQRLLADGINLGAAPTFEVVPTPEFSAFDCVIETEGGVVRAGLHEQLEQVRTILAAAQYEEGAEAGAPAMTFDESGPGSDAAE